MFTVNPSIYAGVSIVATLLVLAFPPTRRRFVRWLGQNREAARRYSREGGAIPWRSGLVFGFFPALVLCLANGRSISSYDNYGIQLTTVSLIEYGSFDLSPLLGNRRADGTVDCTRSLPPGICTAEKFLTIYPIGTLVFSLPVFLVAKAVGTDLTNHHLMWRLAKITAALLAGTVMLFFYLLALRLGPEIGALVVTIFLTTGSAVLSTLGQGLWSHDGVALGAVLSLFLVFLPKKIPDLYLGWGLGLIWSVMVACRLTSVMMIAPLFVWLLVYRTKAAVWSVVGSLVFIAPWFAGHFAVFGHPLGPQFLVVQGHPQGFSIAKAAVAFYGLLFSPGTGLFIYQPWLWLLLGALGLRALPQSVRLLLGAQFLLHLAFCSTWTGLTGQACRGTRYLAEAIPVLALLLVPVVAGYWHRLAFRRGAYALGILAFLIQANGVYGSGTRWYFDPPAPGLTDVEKRALDWTDPAFLYPFYRRVTPN